MTRTEQAVLAAADAMFTADAKMNLIFGKRQLDQLWSAVRQLRAERAPQAAYQPLPCALQGCRSPAAPGQLGCSNEHQELIIRQWKAMKDVVRGRANG